MIAEEGVPRVPRGSRSPTSFLLRTMNESSVRRCDVWEKEPGWIASLAMPFLLNEGEAQARGI